MLTLTLARVLLQMRERRSESHGREASVDHNMPTGKFEIAFNIGIVVYVEMAIKWNNISGVNSLSSPGQFMPFFIARLRSYLIWLSLNPAIRSRASFARSAG